MFRPAKITHPVEANDGKPFDASKGFLTVRKTEDSCTNEDLELAQCIVIFQHAQALNPPIKVTQAVLKAMEKVPEAKYLVQECSGLGRADKYPLEYYTNGTKSSWYYKSKEDYKDDRNYGDSHPYGDYIQADDCPLALQVLLGFTTEGVPKDV
jgi:hypothetical protein